MMAAALNLVVLTVDLPSRGKAPNHQGANHLLILLAAAQALLLVGNNRHHLQHRPLIRNRDLTGWLQMMIVSRPTGALIEETRHLHRLLHRRQLLGKLSRNQTCSLTHRNLSHLSHLNLCPQDQLSHPLDLHHKPSDLHLLQDLRHDQPVRYPLSALLPCKLQHNTDFKAQLTSSEVTMLPLTPHTLLRCRLSLLRILSLSYFYVTAP